LTLTDPIAIKDREVISLLVGGGKAVLMFALGQEFSCSLPNPKTPFWA
jgi:hypothetical protein